MRPNRLRRRQTGKSWRKSKNSRMARHSDDRPPSNATVEQVLAVGELPGPDRDGGTSKAHRCDAGLIGDPVWPRLPLSAPIDLQAESGPTPGLQLVVLAPHKRRFTRR